MPDFLEWFFLAIVIALASYWLNAIRSKELARDASRRACVRAQVQFLDDTVALRQVKLRRNVRGHLSFWREYRFEFTLGDDIRYGGEVILLGKQVQNLLLYLTLEEKVLP